MLTAAILIGLSGWRLANLIVNEVGPFDVFLIIRDKVIGFGPIEGPFQKLLLCIYCMSVWTTLLMAGIYAIEPRAVIVIAAMSIALMPEVLNGGSKH